MSLITPDFGLLVWMTLIFGIVFFVLAKWGFPMIIDSVQKRADRINDSIRQAREAEEKLRNLASEQAAIVEDARKEQSRILKEAANARDKMVEQAKVQAQDEASKSTDCKVTAWECVNFCDLTIFILSELTNSGS